MFRMGRTGLMGVTLTAVLLASGCSHCCKHPLFARRPANCCPPRGAVNDPYLPPVAPVPPPGAVGGPPPGAAFGPGPSADVVVPGPAVNGRGPAFYYNGR